MESKASLIFLIPVILLSLAFQTSAALAQEKKVYTIEASIAEALENNWSLKAKKEKIEQAGNVRKRARAEFLPKLSTSYGYTRLSEVYKSAPVSLGIFGTIPGRDQNTQDNYQWKGTVTQPVFTGFALTSSYRLAELGIDQSEMEVELEKLDLVLKVKETYLDILGVDKALGVAKKAVESLESHVKVASSFYKVGMIPINDLLKSQVELANAQQDLVKALNATKLTRANFNTILSRQISAPVELKDILVYRPEKKDFENCMEKALENRPEIKLLDINIDQTDQQIRLVKSKNYPEVALTYDYIKEGDHPDVSGSPFHDANSWEVMAGVKWTFWEWGKTYYEVREKLSLKKELIQTKKALEDGIRLEIKDALLALEEAEKNIPTTRRAVEQAEENLRVSEERYKAQVTTSTEVLDAQTLLTEGSMNYYRALYDHNLAKARLRRAIGEY
ncbi:MAG: TolC family protein [Desulfobacterales bacterium]|nr:TolC family protein [Desulfobacterales bacterium]